MSRTLFVGQHPLSRRSFVAGAAAAVFGAGVAGLVGCSSDDASSAGSFSEGASAGRLCIGTLATEDILPFWVAQSEGAFEAAGVNAEVTVFQSATELIAGISSGAVQMAMTDIMVSASVFASGTDLALSWVTLGTTPAQGRFGIQTGPDSGITSVGQLAGVPVGVGSNTILEYVMDVLLERAGLNEGDIVTSELQKLPVRYQAMMSGEVKAAALPASLLALGEASGATTLVDDTAGENISQSVMAVRADWLEGDGAAVIDTVKGVWNDCASRVNADPEKYRDLLVQNANLSDAVAKTYVISEYPQCMLPTNDMVEPVLEWMRGKGYLTAALSYDEKTGSFKAE
jgi:NitT/TauT family transport system substrate-binding protein